MWSGRTLWPCGPGRTPGARSGRDNNRITLNTTTMEEHDIDALIAWKYDTYVNGLDTDSDD